MAGYIGSKSSVTQVDGYSEAEADAEFVNDPSSVITVSGSNVGIGTASPSAKLHVANVATEEYVFETTNNSTRSQVEVKSKDSSGNAVQTRIASIGDGVYGMLYTLTNHNLTFATNNAAPQMTLDTSGNVGIGGTPSKPLHLKASSGWATMRLEGGADSGGELEFYRGSTKAGAIFFDASSNLNIRTGNTERMRVESSGDIRVGSGNGSNLVGPKLHGGNSSGTNNYWEVRPEADGSSAGRMYSRVNNDNPRTHITFGNPNGSVGTIITDGSSTGYNTSSDYRLKENVVDLTGASARVNQLDVKRFNFIADGTDTAVDGFLAHEVATVVPEAITGTKDAMRDEEYEVTPATGDIYTPATDEVDEVIHSADAEQPETLEDGQQWRETTAAVMGTRSVPDYQGIDQSKLVPLLTAALQEALTEIASLKTRVEALEA